MIAKLDNRVAPDRPGPHRVALLATAFTFPLLLVGGAVSVYKVGMAVPDWPTTFGINMFLYNFVNAAWGVQVEHTHRLFGSAVGLLCILLAVWFLVADRRRWIKVLGVFTLLAVIGQGILGGMRVRMVSTDLAFVHGCSAEAFFALMAALCVFTGRDWVNAAPTKQVDDANLRRKSATILGLVYSQVIFGAAIRHYGTMAAVLIHAVIALMVWGHVIGFVLRIERRKSDFPYLVSGSRVMAVLVTAQVVLGACAWWLLRPFDGIPHPVFPFQAMIRVGHQGVGALLLATSVVVFLRSMRHLASASLSTAGASIRSAAAASELETVAS